MSEWTDWQGCYDDGWGELIVGEAYAHPAKFRAGLIDRIYKHGFERGWWVKGDCVGDPFGGIGGGAIYAAYNGLAWRGVELEPKFVELFEMNVKLHQRRWENGGDPIPTIIQGDSREFAKLVSCSSIVTSPPFVDCNVNIGAVGDTPGKRQQIHDSKPREESYGSTPGQIGNLKAGELGAVVTSPPYADSIQGGGDGIDWSKIKGEEGNPNRSVGRGAIAEGYGSAPGNIGNLKAIVTSPPYADSVKGDHGETETAKESRDKRTGPGGSLGQSQRHGGYGVAEGNIGNLKAVVTSPPWENQEPSHAQNDTPSRERLTKDNPGLSRLLDVEYGHSDGQLGNTSGESYWQAMEAVYDQCRQAIRPGGVLVVVIKDYVKGGKRVPLCDQTLELLESLGFVLVERIRAWVTKTTVHDGLFGDVVEKVERKSFFRRLAEKKGSPPIDWEEVICVRTPCPKQ